MLRISILSATLSEIFTEIGSFLKIISKSYARKQRGCCFLNTMYNRAKQFNILCVRESDSRVYVNTQINSTNALTFV